MSARCVTFSHNGHHSIVVDGWKAWITEATAQALSIPRWELRHVCDDVFECKKRVVFRRAGRPTSTVDLLPGSRLGDYVSFSRIFTSA